MLEDANDDEVEDDGNREGGQEVVGEQPVGEPAVGVGVQKQQQQLPSSATCLRRPAVCPLYARSVGQSQCARAHLSWTQE